MKDKIILASASPRRIEILKNNGINAEIIPADVDENIPEGTPPHLACMYNALKKALAVESQQSEGVIIAADTIVYNGTMLGKPADEDDAFRMLSELRGKSHSVMTGVALADAVTHRRHVFYEETKVHFGDYSDEEIRQYIASGETMDKAGAYAIQGGWGRMVTSVEGDFANVIGLPWDRLRHELEKFGEQIKA